MALITDLKNEKFHQKKWCYYDRLSDNLVSHSPEELGVSHVV